MGKIENTIKDILIESFDPSVLSVINESNMHNVPEGSESHFKVVVVSNNFKNIWFFVSWLVFYCFRNFGICFLV